MSKLEERVSFGQGGPGIDQRGEESVGGRNITRTAYPSGLPTGGEKAMKTQKKRNLKKIKGEEERSRVVGSL